MYPENGCVGRHSSGLLLLTYAWVQLSSYKVNLDGWGWLEFEDVTGKTNHFFIISLLLKKEKISFCFL